MLEEDVHQLPEHVVQRFVDLLHEEWVIKVKPTVYYLLVAGLLGFGLATGRNLLKVVLESVYPGLSERGWTLLTRNWIAYFVIMVAALLIAANYRAIF